MSPTANSTWLHAQRMCGQTSGKAVLRDVMDDTSWSCSCCSKPGRSVAHSHFAPWEREEGMPTVLTSAQRLRLWLQPKQVSGATQHLTRLTFRAFIVQMLTRGAHAVHTEAYLSCVRL